tara:strand:- start:285 stop:944 length:660 start_codon:yes stop_codon:yes gene_type:complete
MPIINKGTSFSNGEQLTADKINDLVDLATFNQNATDSNTTTISTAGQLVVNSGGISSAQLAADAVETAKIKDANVTFAKLTDVIDDDTMATATDTTLATSESIKAYVDSISVVNKSTDTGLVTEGAQGSVSLGGGLIVKFGSINHTSSQIAFTFKDSSGSLSPFPNAIYGVNATVNESVSSSSETCSVTSPTVDGCTISGYRGVSGAAVGRVFFVAYGY